MQRTRKDQVFVLLASGFEELDVTTVTQTLRRAGFPVVLVGLTAGPLRGAYGLSLAPDGTLSEVEAGQPQAVVLPGGVQGARQLNADPRVHALLRRVVEQEGYVLALGVADAILYSAGVLERAAAGAAPTEGGRGSSDRWVMVEGPAIRGRDSGAAQEAALALVTLLQGGPG